MKGEHFSGWLKAKITHFPVCVGTPVPCPRSILKYCVVQNLQRSMVYEVNMPVEGYGQSLFLWLTSIHSRFLSGTFIREDCSAPDSRFLRIAPVLFGQWILSSNCSEDRTALAKAVTSCPRFKMAHRRFPHVSYNGRTSSDEWFESSSH